VAFDVLDRSTQRFLDVDDRDRLLARIGVPGPPKRFRGSLTSLDRFDALFGRSADARAEGLVIRTVDGSDPRIAKHVDPAWARIGEAPWAGADRLTFSSRR